jgi:hypothetical protein
MNTKTDIIILPKTLDIVDYMAWELNGLAS